MDQPREIERSNAMTNTRQVAIEFSLPVDSRIVCFEPLYMPSTFTGLLETFWKQSYKFDVPSPNGLISSEGEKDGRLDPPEFSDS
jgi:hypothetical protein